MQSTTTNTNTNIISRAHAYFLPPLASAFFFSLELQYNIFSQHKIMQGRGVQNYSDKPSHKITSATTEFDDALLSRGIVTEEQVYLAKGASVDEAVRLAQEKRGENLKAGRDTSAADKQESFQSKDDEDDSIDDEEDDAFMAKYREERLKELRQQSQQSTAPSFTSIHHITRDQWKEHVNEASMHNRWVMVVLVDGYCKEKVTQELHQLGRGEYDNLQLRTIDATDAIPNWPSDRTPTLFAYHNGFKTQEIIASTRGEFPTATMLAEIFRQWGVFLNDYDGVD